MQKIERYGVFALVFLLVTILAVSLWGEGKDSGLFPWNKNSAGSDKQAQADRPRPRAAGPQQTPQQTPQAGQTPAATPGDAAAQRPRAGALELSGENADPVAAQLRAQRIALAQQRRAEQQAAAQQQPGAQNPLPTPGDVALVDPFALNAAATNAPATEQPLQGQVGAPALPVTEGAVARPNPALTAPTVRQSTGAARSYVVKSGDTLGEIARRELGASARWTEIAALNGNLDPKRLRNGMTLKLPVGPAATGAGAGAPNVAAAPARTNTAARNYTVRSGDTLSAIAARELGSAERWNEIAALNPRLDPTRLSVGAVLALPGGAGSGAPASRPVALDERRSVAAAPRTASKSKVQ